jgi:hypothetical protein
MVSPAMAQKNIDKHIPFAGKESLELDIQIADSITVHTWNKQEVYAKASVSINDNKENEAYLISFDETGKNVRIKACFDEDFFDGRKNNCIETLITWELYIPENTFFTIETIDGNIIIDGMTSDIKAKTISGFIDWTVKPDLKADLKLKTISGRFYSNLDNISDDRCNTFPPVLTGKMNNGGYLVELETISGDIFCRKSR